MLRPAASLAYDDLTQPSMCAGGDGICGCREQLRPLRKHERGFLGQQTDELLAILAKGVAAHERTLADEVALAGVHDPRHPEVVGRLGAVRLLADDHEPFLGAQHVHRLGPVGRDAERRARSVITSHTASACHGETCTS